MSPLDTFRTALSAIFGNRLRAGLTLLGVVIGVTAVIALMKIGRGVQQSITSRIASQGTNQLFVQPGVTNTGNASTLTLEDAYSLVDVVFAPSVKGVAPEIRTGAQVVAGRENTSTQVIGVTPEYEDIRNLTVEFGEFISQPQVRSNSEVAVLGADISETLFGIRIPLGQPIRINGRRFTVIGVLEDTGGTAFGGTGNLVYIPITTSYYRLSLQRTTQGDVAVDQITVQARGEDFMDQAEDEVAMSLRLRHRITGEDDFTISSNQELLETLEETTNALVIFLGAIAGISLIVGGIGIMNIMLVSVTERTREIGIRKAMGAKRRDILFQFITEATLLSLGGGLIGLTIGLASTPILNGRNVIGPRPIETGFSIDIAIIALVVSALIGLASGIYPAMRAAKMHPIDALRYE